MKALLYLGVYVTDFGGSEAWVVTLEGNRRLSIAYDLEDGDIDMCTGRVKVPYTHVSGTVTIDIPVSLVDAAFVAMRYKKKRAQFAALWVGFLLGRKYIDEIPELV